MSREVRMVPPGWEHPRNADGGYVPLHGQTYEERLAELAELRAEYGEVDDEEQRRYEDRAGCWPTFAPGTATRYVMYETCTEGTPISPPCATPEALARWLADHGASSFGSRTATYAQWLATIRAGGAVSAVLGADGLVSGVEFQAGGGK